MPDEPLDLDAIEARARTTAHFSPAPGPIALANDVCALIARVREQEQEIARLRAHMPNDTPSVGHVQVPRG